MNGWMDAWMFSGAPELVSWFAVVYVCSPSCPVCLSVLSSASVFVYLPSRVPMSVSVSLYSFSVITFVVLSLCLRPSCSHVHHLMFHPSLRPFIPSCSVKFTCLSLSVTSCFILIVSSLMWHVQFCFLCLVSYDFVELCVHVSPCPLISPSVTFVSSQPLFAFISVNKAEILSLVLSESTVCHTPTLYDHIIFVYNFE